MNKKIIALILSVITVALCFTACGKPKKENVYGTELAVAYDDNGYAVFNDKGMIRIYDLDAEGKTQKNSDGSVMYKYYDVGGSYVHGNIYDSQLYALKAPDGWTANDNATFDKNGTQQRCKIIIIKVKDTASADEFNEYYSTHRTDDEKTANENPGAYSAEYSDMFAIGSKNMPAYSAKHSFYKDGQLAGKTEQIYFLMNAEIWMIKLETEDLSLLDSKFDFVKYVRDNFVTK